MDYTQGKEKIWYIFKGEFMIDSLNAAKDDCCYFLLRNDNKIRFGTIVKVIANESAVVVVDGQEGGCYVVWEKNAAWDEKELKGQKWEKPHNYIREIPKENSDEKEPSERVSDVRDGKKKTTKRKRTKRKSTSVSKRTSRKS